MKRTSTYFAKPGENPERWRVMDAQGQTLGRLARNIAIALQGKDKPTYAPHAPTGDFVVVTNAADMRVTGNKLDDKMYYRHSGYPGGLRSHEAEIQRVGQGLLGRNAASPTIITTINHTN